MKNLLYKSFGKTQADFFEDVIAYPLSRVYTILGKTIPWENSDTPEQPLDTVQYRNDALKSGIIMKKISASDIEKVVPRIDWESNVVYTAYHQTLNLYATSVQTQLAGGNVNVSILTANTIASNGINFSTDGNVVIGRMISLGDERREIVSFNASHIQVNTAFDAAYTSSNAFVTIDADSGYYYKFYVRNTQDQVFKCLDNNGNSQSQYMPAISIDGQLPENPFIQTDDGYKWKYLYTVPTGLKTRFFNADYMPTVKDSTVVANAVDGRIDIINILSAGTGYYAGGSINNYDILTVSGDGSGADITVDITEGRITDINILDGGTGYTYATIAISDPLKSAATTDANLEVVISPPGGHGSDPANELGASTLMIAVDFDGNMSGDYPIQNDGTDDFRRIALVRDPKNESGTLASNSVYSMYTSMIVEDPPADFEHDAEVFAGASYETATFKATVIHFNNIENTLYLNNIVGDPADVVNRTLYQKDNLTARAKVYTVISPTINILSGDLIYVENRAPVVRNNDQTETVRLILNF
jgi:hypothetical protein